MMLLLLHPFDNNPTAAAAATAYTRTDTKVQSPFPKCDPSPSPTDQPNSLMQTYSREYVNKINLDKGHVYSRMYIHLRGVFLLYCRPQ
jgi:hypothetical protein